MAVHDELGDEGIAQRFGPLRIALWLREHEGYRENNSRLWQVRRALIQSRIWAAYSLDDVPLIPEWFGAILPHAIAWERSGHPHVWCTMLGFPSAEIRSAAIDILESEKPSGLMLLERDAPEPASYTLPVVGFIARDVYLTLEPEHPRRYDHWRGYETLGLVPDEEAGIMEIVDADYAEQMLVRRLALSLGRWVGAPRGDSEYDGVVGHARELWSLGAVTAAGTVAGTAFERLLTEALSHREQSWLTVRKRTLGPLIDKVVKHDDLDPKRRTMLSDFRELRNRCAHAIADEGTSEPENRSEDLAVQVDLFIEWLETQSFDEVNTHGLSFPSHHGIPETPEELHELAEATGRRAADEQTPTPMKVDGTVVVDGAAGFARILLKPGDALAQWLIETERADEVDAWVYLGVQIQSQSVEKAGAYAEAYVRTLNEHGLFASYETRLD